MKKSNRLIPLREPQQRRSRVTYDAILEATAQILVERGYAATTTNHIAKRAGISIGSLYQYFPNKEAIAVDLLQRHIVSGPAYIESNITRSLKDRCAPEEMLKRFIVAACDHHTNSSALHKVLEEEVPQPVHIREAIRRNENHYTEVLASWIEQQRPQQVPNITVAARLVFYMIKSMTHWYILNQQSEVERTVFVDELTSIIMRYLFPFRVRGRSKRSGFGGLDGR